MTARRASTVAVTSVVAAALLVVVLAAWAASIGPGEVLRGNGPDRPSATVETSAPPSPGQNGAYRPAPEHRQATPWVRGLALLLNIAAAVAILALTVLLAGRAVNVLRGRRERRRWLDDGGEGSGFEVLAPAAAVAHEMRADAAGQRELLLEGTPRNAVVACWHRFETQAARAGLERRPWETSSEYTMRVLDLVDAHEPAVARLAGLYREARFSEHELTEQHRRDALEALDAVHRTIGVPA